MRNAGLTFPGAAEIAVAPAVGDDQTPRNTKRQRLEAAGYRHVSGWLPAARADWVEAEIAEHAEKAERIAETRKPSGRPKKPDPTT